MSNVFVNAAAEAMRIKREELIDQPLARIWRELAEVALIAAKTEQARGILGNQDTSRESFHMLGAINTKGEIE